MTSRAEAIFVCKSFNGNGLPHEWGAPAIRTVLKKKSGDATLALEVSDATLRDPQAMKGLLLSAEKPLGSGVKGALAYVPATRDAIGSVTVDKKLNGNDLTLRASYHLKGDVFVLQETWKFDKQNKVVGTYNFAKEEAAFTYEHTRGSLKLGAHYSLKAEKPVVSVEKKAGKGTYFASYGIKDEAALLSYNHKPFKVVLRGKAGAGGVKGVSGTVMLTHEFNL